MKKSSRFYQNFDLAKSNSLYVLYHFWVKLLIYRSKNNMVRIGASLGQFQKFHWGTFFRAFLRDWLEASTFQLNIHAMQA